MRCAQSAARTSPALSVGPIVTYGDTFIGRANGGVSARSRPLRTPDVGEDTMQRNTLIVAALLFGALGGPIYAQDDLVTRALTDTTREPDIRTLVSRLDLEKYKATI